MAVILYSRPSPYSAKIRMAAQWCSIDAEARIVDTSAQPAELIAANPLGKIPVFIGDDGNAVFDSRVITQHFNRMSGGALFPRKAERRLQVERLEALADGLNDVLVAYVYELRKRPEEKVHQPWLDAQWEKATRALDHLEAALPRLGKKADAGQIALRAALGYLALRFEGRWERGRPKLQRWVRRFDERFPELAELVPQSA